jgi:hypothetical protein
VVNALLTCASGTAEREATLLMLAQRPQKKRVTLAGDKGYDTKDFVADLRACQVTPHVAQNNKGRRSAIDQRTNFPPDMAQIISSKYMLTCYYFRSRLRILRSNSPASQPQTFSSSHV